MLKEKKNFFKDHSHGLLYYYISTACYFWFVSYTGLGVATVQEGNNIVK